MKKTLTFVGFLALISVFSACRKEKPLLIENHSQLAENNFVFKEGPIVMGETLENPYSVENMQKSI